MRTTKLTALALTVTMVLSVVAPGAVAAQTSTAGNSSIVVETDDPSDVTATSATLNGNLTTLSGVDNATVWFEYWVEDDAANATNTSETTLTDPGVFSESIDGLDNDTTYIYQAHARANGTTVTGAEVAFTTSSDAEEEAPKNFGLQVSDFIHGLLDGGIDDDETFGRLVSQFVLANNPGSDNRPDHAGPPWLDDDEDDGNETDDDADDERGPPEHAGPPDHAGPKDDDENDESNEDEDSETDDEESQEENEDEEADEDESEADEGDAEDDEEDDDRGPPEDAGPPEDDEDEDEDA